jgi:anti-anti-sigma factor
MPASHKPAFSDRVHTEVLDCRDARLTVRKDEHLTVIAVTGEIYASNVDDVSRRVRTLIPPVGELIVDLSRIEFIGVAGLKVLLWVNAERARTNSPWVLVASSSVARLLRVSDPGGTLPMVTSSAEALRRIRTADLRSRPLRLVPPHGRR